MNSSTNLLFDLLWLAAIWIIALVLKPLKANEEPLTTRQQRTFPTTAYNLTFLFMNGAIAFVWVVLWLVKWVSSPVYWATVGVCFIVACASNWVFGKGIAGRFLTLTLCAATFIVSIALVNIKSLGFAAAGAAFWLLWFEISAVYVFRHRRDYSNLWKSGILDKRKPLYLTIIFGYYALSLALVLLT